MIGRLRQTADGGFANRCVRCGRDGRPSDAIVDHMIVRAHRVIVHDRGISINIVRVIAPESMCAHVMVAEMRV